MAVIYLYCIGFVACFYGVGSVLLPNDDKKLPCDVRAQLDSGWVCGSIRPAEEGVQYASFRGIPYAQQPLGALRFKELQNLSPWKDVLLATEEGPICPQYDELYGRLVNSAEMSESCILANVHVPLNISSFGSKSESQDQPKLPILVFIHGGAFQAGSGNSDVHGPEYLVSKGAIVITFNYRLNVFGYLSLNSTKIPGNNGLRDAITLLKWVQRNALAFGGDPDNVTLGGHSSGAVNTHLLSLSEASKGLFKRVILMSGVANAGFYTASPIYAETVAQMFLGLVGINSTDADEIHDQLIQMPLEKIMEGYRVMQFQTAVVAFAAVVESKFDGVTQILDDDPTNLIKQGRGKDLPMIIGSTSNECETFKRKITYLNMVKLIEQNPAIVLAPQITYTVAPTRATELSQTVLDRYFQGNVTIEKYIPCCSDTFFVYPAIKVAEWRASLGGAPAYRYEFNFDSTFNVAKAGLMLNYEGSGHIEDLTFAFRSNSLMRPNEKSFPPRTRDDLMKNWMTSIVVNFMRCSKPVCDDEATWPATDAQQLNYQQISEPVFTNNNVPLTEAQRNMFDFHNQVFQSAGI
ncbi:juvenile hormone esterase-like [Trichoplusia ni]|uniref:Carboxylic ester hydrolase n=1 Tax=Trichoplusia ni TaxID=7111 RepID=A0A7E5WSS6_TRINI|nr:juvenile hormone esterase-like [Trichoplusia ni]